MEVLMKIFSGPRASALFLSGLIATGAAGGKIPWRVADAPWKAERGSQRADLRVGAGAPAVRAHLPWRRRDRRPEEKAVLVFGAAGGERVRNVVAISVDRERGEIAFEASRAGDHHVYYMPCRIGGSAFPSTVYARPEPMADGC
jgi:hypothetical protein